LALKPKTLNASRELPILMNLPREDVHNLLLDKAICRLILESIKPYVDGKIRFDLAADLSEVKPEIPLFFYYIVQNAAMRIDNKWAEIISNCPEVEKNCLLAISVRQAPRSEITPKERVIALPTYGLNPQQGLPAFASHFSLFSNRNLAHPASRANGSSPNRRVDRGKSTLYGAEPGFAEKGDSQRSIETDEQEGRERLIAGDSPHPF
jgi:hypothetical protein